MTLAKLVELYDKILVYIFGYRNVVRVEDIVLLVAGFFLGVLTMAVLSGKFLYRVKKVEDLGKGKIKMLRLNDEGESRYIVSFKSFHEAVEQVLLLSFSPFFTKRNYSIRDEKRTKKFLIIMFFIAVIVLIWAIFSIANVFAPLPKIK